MSQPVLNRLVLRDHTDRQIDVHPIELDESGWSMRA